MSGATAPKAANEPAAGTIEGSGVGLATAEFERAHTPTPARPIGLLFEAADDAAEG